MKVHAIAVIVTLILGTLLAPLTADTQEPAKILRIGVLQGGSPSASARLDEVFRQALRDLGYVEGQNIAVEQRWAEGRFDRLPNLAAELIRLQVSVIVAGGDPVILAAKQATSTIPIVMSSVGDPVGAGFVASLARPGGNITGVTNLAVGLTGKWLELLKEVIPGIAQVAVLRNAANRTHDVLWEEAQGAAQRLGLKAQGLEVRSPAEFEAAFEAISRERAGALVVLPDPMLSGQRARLAELAAKGRLPLTYAFREYVDAGGLISYGPSAQENRRNAAAYVDKILKGANPADLPVEPGKFELVINLKTAKALGLTIPQSILLRADEVIE
ncbi:MAG: ABC transporter substrate-binding protein [Candidatus Rokubacteria bacterium]|nr:ABC transporter substrate-binding protein [Candidatus Rokubacteria bacterium]